jgi:hypothetical protein
MADEKKVKIHIPRGASNEDPNFYIKVNGKRYVLPKGKDHMVPEHIAYEYERSKRAAEIQDENREQLLEAAKKDLPR